MLAWLFCGEGKGNKNVNKRERERKRKKEKEKNMAGGSPLRERTATFSGRFCLSKDSALKKNEEKKMANEKRNKANLL